MNLPSRLVMGAGLAAALVAAPSIWLHAQERQGQAPAAALPPGCGQRQGRGGGGNNPFPGGANPDGSLRPTRPVTALFTQDAYTEYEILQPGSASFRIRYLPETRSVGATELDNATRGGSEGSDISVFDPRTGKATPFTYTPDPCDP